MNMKSNSSTGGPTSFSAKVCCRCGSALALHRTHNSHQFAYGKCPRAMCCSLSPRPWVRLALEGELVHTVLGLHVMLRVAAAEILPDVPDAIVCSQSAAIVPVAVILYQKLRHPRVAPALE